MTRPERIEKGLYWDEAWTLVHGCSPVSAGCDRCWAAAASHMRVSHPNPKIAAANADLTEPGPHGPRFNGVVRLNPAALDKPQHRQRPTTYAVWNDLFQESVPADFIRRMFDVMRRAGHHTFQILTKRSERLADLAPRLDWPGNVWMGVTVEHADYVGRIDDLRAAGARLKFLSLEPLLGPMPALDLAAIDWVIVGGETGRAARPMHPEWVRSIRDQCAAAGVPFFLKQMHVDGKVVKMPELDGRRWDELPHF